MTNSALEYEPKCWGRGGGCGVLVNEYSCARGAQINFGDLTPYLTSSLNQQCIAGAGLPIHGERFRGTQKEDDRGPL
jgi:hypothetical protein